MQAVVKTDKPSSFHTSLNLPIINSPKRKNEPEKIIYKKFFVPHFFDDFKVPCLEQQVNFDKGICNYQEKIAAYKKITKYANGRINCVSVIPNRDNAYVSKSNLRKKLKLSVDLPKLKILCKTPVNDPEFLSPFVNKIHDPYKVIKKFKADAMINTE
jgi:hypothetical protein